MRLYSEIMKKSGLNELINSEKVCWSIGNGGYFQGVKTIDSFSFDKVILFMRSGKVEISGSNFSVEKYFEGDLLLKGNIFSLSYIPKGKG